ncbi:hypothetical protein [Piscinibacter terrae]|uniref:hypothetical protein n=1 Tax=Piscinibacter terrae TaxID=2496871 RepID=UPI00138673B1|nr:hypothetical protein [Albitalea terrae]
MTQTAQASDLFDFWIGDWDASWIGTDGKPGRGRNRIGRILDGKVLEENFEETPDGTSPPLKGRSLSVLHQLLGQWRQSWVDNQGGYFSFTGLAEGDRRIFITDTVMKNGQPSAQRMVFHDIRKDTFTWDWESTGDGGKTWKLLWRIHYKRHAP